MDALFLVEVVAEENLFKVLELNKEFVQLQMESLNNKINSTNRSKLWTITKVKVKIWRDLKLEIERESYSEWVWIKITYRPNLKFLLKVLRIVVSFYHKYVKIKEIEVSEHRNKTSQTNKQM